MTSPTFHFQTIRLINTQPCIRLLLRRDIFSYTDHGCNRHQKGKTTYSHIKNHDFEITIYDSEDKGYSWKCKINLNLETKRNHVLFQPHKHISFVPQDEVNNVFFILNFLLRYHV